MRRLEKGLMKHELYLSSGENLPCIWEKGCMNKKFGKSTIVCTFDGCRKEAIMISEDNCDAMIPVSIGDMLIKVIIEPKEANIRIFEVRDIWPEKKKTIVKLISKYHREFHSEEELWKMLRNCQKIRRDLEYYDSNLKVYLGMQYKFSDAIYAALARATNRFVDRPYFILTG